jgi:isopenicillin-N epimerase
MDHLRNQFLIDPSITFLNFGSFGACPKPVFQRYQEFQLELEAEPVKFIARTGPEYLKTARASLSNFIGCASDEVVYVTNPTYAINLIARALKLQPGDEILTTNLEYGAMDRTWNFYCREKGARYVRQQIDLPIVDKETFINAFFKGCTTRTKAIFISHITSATALILPVQEICEEARRRGLITIVDGAHAPAHVGLNLKTLPADIYTGACHKWMMAPKGSSFLYVRKELQALFEPLIISWGYESDQPSDSRFLDYHQFNGTRDFSAFLCTPACIDFMRAHNWLQVAADCRALVHDQAERFANLLRTEPMAPVNADWIGQMLSLSIRTDQPELLQRELFENHRIEVPVMRQEGRTYIRFSINAFNGLHDLDALYVALETSRLWAR